VPFDQAESMVDALEDHDKKFKFIEIDDAGHNVLNTEENIELVYKEVEAFLATHLLH
jgi:dipeptidyl aminopeptidase/acylaminoacyl peptidase